MARVQANKSVDSVIRGSLVSLCRSGSQPDIAFMSQVVGDGVSLSIAGGEFSVGVEPKEHY